VRGVLFQVICPGLIAALFQDIRPYSGQYRKKLSDTSSSGISTPVSLAPHYRDASAVATAMESAACRN
jgi:hypothetical protein